MVFGTRDIKHWVLGPCGDCMQNRMAEALSPNTHCKWKSSDGLPLQLPSRLSAPLATSDGLFLVIMAKILCPLSGPPLRTPFGPPLAASSRSQERLPVGPPTSFSGNFSSDLLSPQLPGPRPTTCLFDLLAISIRPAPPLKTSPDDLGVLLRTALVTSFHGLFGWLPLLLL